MKEDIRWKQRFQNFEKAFLFLKNGVHRDSYDELQRAGLIQSFEFTFELAWKTLKDYLQQQGFQVQYPREVIKQAFSTELIKDGTHWINMLDKRNELTHTYDDVQAQLAVKIIKEHFFPLLEQVYNTLKTLCSA